MFSFPAYVTGATFCSAHISSVRGVSASSASSSSGPSGGMIPVILGISCGPACPSSSTVLEEICKIVPSRKGVPFHFVDPILGLCQLKLHTSRKTTHSLPSSEIIVNLSPDKTMYESPSHVLCFFPWGLRLEHHTLMEYRTIGRSSYQRADQRGHVAGEVDIPSLALFTRSTGSRAISFFREIGYCGCWIRPFKETGFRGINFFFRIEEPACVGRIKVSSLPLPRLAVPFPKTRPEVKSCFDTEQSTSISLLPSWMKVPIQAPSGLGLPAAILYDAQGQQNMAEFDDVR